MLTLIGHMEDEFVGIVWVIAVGLILWSAGPNRSLALWFAYGKLHACF